MYTYTEKGIVIKVMTLKEYRRLKKIKYESNKTK